MKEVEEEEDYVSSLYLIVSLDESFFTVFLQSLLCFKFDIFQNEK